MPCDAPVNDLHFIKDILDFKAINQVISKAALEAFSKHTRYLTEKLIPLAIFNNKLDEHQKQLLAKKFYLQHQYLLSSIK